MVQLTLEYEGISLRISLECAEDAEWLKEFFLPWFEVSNDAPDVDIRVSSDRARFAALLAGGAAAGQVAAFMMDTRQIDLPLWNGADGVQTLYDEQHRVFFPVADNRIELVAENPGMEIRLPLMRVLRELAMGAAQLRGGRFLHASAFAVHGGAAVITGPRGAGKTSLLNYVLSHSGAQFLSNDRLLVNRDGPFLRLRGMPTIVSIRDGTLALFPGLGKSIERQRFTTRATMAEARLPDAAPQSRVIQGRRGVSPRQYCALLDCQPVPAARGGLLLFPRQTGRPGGLELKRLDRDAARDRLEDCLFGHIHPDRLSAAFTFRPPGPAQSPAPDDAALLTRLATALPAFDCALGTDTYTCDAGARQLLHLLKAPRIDAEHVNGGN